MLPLAATGVAASAVLLLWPRDCSFDSDTWASARKVSGSDARFEAIRDELRTLVECEKLDGLTREEVHGLLGRQDRARDGGRSWFYDTGIPEPRSDYPGLEVDFDPSGRVTRARVPGFIEP